MDPRKGKNMMKLVWQQIIQGKHVFVTLFLILTKPLKRPRARYCPSFVQLEKNKMQMLSKDIKHQKKQAHKRQFYNFCNTRQLYCNNMSKKVGFYYYFFYVIFHHPLTYRQLLGKRLCASGQTFVLVTTNLKIIIHNIGN